MRNYRRCYHTGGSVNKVIDLLKDKVDIIGVIVMLDERRLFL